MTEALLEEYREVAVRLLADRKIRQEQFESLVSGIAVFVSAARVVEPRTEIVIWRDPEDNMVLECCRAARATVLITVDAPLDRIPLFVRAGTCLTLLPGSVDTLAESRPHNDSIVHLSDVAGKERTISFGEGVCPTSGGPS